MGRYVCRYVKLHLEGKIASDEYAEMAECGSRVIKGTMPSARTRGYGYPADLTADGRPDRLTQGISALECCFQGLLMARGKEGKKESQWISVTLAARAA